MKVNIKKLTASAGVGAFALICLGSVVGLPVVGAVLPWWHRVVVVVAEKRLIYWYRGVTVLLSG
jgi:hypothetical protein